MNKPNGYDTAPAYDGSFETLPAGGYICEIISARVEMGKYSEQMVLALDIAEGEKKAFFKRQHEKKKGVNPSAKWPCVFYQSTLNQEGTANGYFKGLIKSVEESNGSYQWEWDEATLKGKRVGFVFQEQEWQGDDMKIRTNTKPIQARSVSAIMDGVPVPEPKKLVPVATRTFTSQQSVESGFTQVDEDELPF